MQKNIPKYEEYRLHQLNRGKIIGVAIKRNDVVFSLKIPYRHHDLIMKMSESGVTTPIGHGDDIQGFLTDRGFMDRVETAIYLRIAEFDPALSGSYTPKLYSEDLW